MPPIPTKPPVPVAIAGLYLITFLAILLAIGLQVEGMSRASQERMEAEVWPPVTAQVLACYVDRSSGVRRRSGVYKIQCKFAYVVNDKAYESRTQTIGQRYSRWNSNSQPADAPQMEAWVNQHKKGSTEIIHYDPANPSKISLAGADSVLRSNSAAVSLAAAKELAPLAAILFVASLFAWKRTRPTDPA